METSLIEKVEQETNDTVAKANAIAVVDTKTRLVASEYVKVIKCMQKEVSETFDPIVAKAKATHTEACNQRSKYLDPLLLAEKTLKAKGIAWDTEQENIRIAAQAELDRKAKAEEDRKRKELEDRARKAEEAARVEREAKEKAEAQVREAQEAQRKAEEAAKNAKNAKERAIAAKAEAEAHERAEVARREAAEAEARAAKQDAKNEALKQKAEEVHVEAPIAQDNSVKIAGQTTRDEWYAEIIDLTALVKAIAEGKAPMTFIVPDMVALNKQAKSMKGSWSYPGVAFKSKKIMAVRTK